MDDSDNYQWGCVRCGTRTTRLHSLGMLECRYHPCVHGVIRPLQSSQVSQKEMANAGGCQMCEMAYFGKQHLLSATLGCTAIDHLAPGEDLSFLLGQQPYDVMPTERWFSHGYVSASKHNVNSNVMQRSSFHFGKRSPVFFFSAANQMRQPNGQRMFMVIKLFKPSARACGIAEEECKKHDRGIVLSLENLYNESAEKYNYARMGENDWKRRVLHSNRYFLQTGDKDTGGGIATMTAEEVCSRELYADTHAIQEMNSFVPFVVVLRVEVQDVRITCEI